MSDFMQLDGLSHNERDVFEKYIEQREKISKNVHVKKKPVVIEDVKSAALLNCNGIRNVVQERRKRDELLQFTTN